MGKYDTLTLNALKYKIYPSPTKINFLTILYMQNLGFAVSQPKRQMVYGIPASFKGQLANDTKEKQEVVPDEPVPNESQVILESVNLNQSDLQEREDITNLENNPITFAKNIK